MIIVIDPRQQTDWLPASLQLVAQAMADPFGAQRFVEARDEVEVVIVAEEVDTDSALLLAETLRLSRPDVGVILLREKIDAAFLSRALRSGVRDVVNPSKPVALTDAVVRIQKLARQLRNREEPEGVRAEKGRVVTVFSAKGGCGKTTLATNLAACLADGGRREVVIIDADLAFGDVATVLQLTPSHTVADAVPMGHGLDQGAVEALLTPHSPGLWAIAAPPEPGVDIPVALLLRIVAVLRSRFDFVVVDTPPAFNDHVLALLDVSELLLLLATLDIPALKNLKLTVQTLDLLEHPRERSRVVLNRADSKVGLSVAEVERNLGLAIAAQIPSSRAVPATINRGVPIVYDQPRHAVSIAIRELAARHILHQATPEAPAQAREGNHRRTSLRKVGRL